jgi:hypothetical protein
VGVSAPVLNACPCCGGLATYRFIEGRDLENAGACYAECAACGLSTKLWFPLGDDVFPLIAEAWNRRA